MDITCCGGLVRRSCTMKLSESAKEMAPNVVEGRCRATTNVGGDWNRTVLCLVTCLTERQLHRGTGFDNSFYDDEDKIEVLTRIKVRPKFKGVIGTTKMDAPLLKRMATVFFDITYPTPPVG